MDTFETLDRLALDTVTGGNAQPAGTAGPNRDGGSFNVGLSARGVKVGVQGDYQRTRTDYATCVAETRASGGGAADIRANCGLPGGGQ
ncbi:MAG: hypothetical protein ACTHU0_20955 [Kofleriaceae bacterium]